jgi:tetratricopeptide (TPR) repeat protein
MTNPPTTKSQRCVSVGFPDHEGASRQRVRFEEVTPTNEIVVYFNAQLPDLIAGTGLPIFPGYDDLDDIQFAYITLPSGNTVVLGQYGNAPEIGVDLYVELDRKNNSTAITTSIPALVVETLRYLAIPKETAVWFHPDYETEIEDLYSQDGELDSIPKIPTEELALNTEYEPIDCFYYALEIYTREKLPEHWAMLQHNLGLAYYHKYNYWEIFQEILKNKLGSFAFLFHEEQRWMSLLKSIQCYNKSLEIFTQNRFPEKWQINQEDLSQSLEAWKVEKSNLVKYILALPRVRHMSHSYSLILEYADLSGADLSYINLSDMNLSGANLFSVNLFSADLSDTKLNGVNLSDANLSFANLSDADLSDANVDNTKFRYNQGISESMRQNLIDRGAIFEDAPGDRSESQTLVPR